MHEPVDKKVKLEHFKGEENGNGHANELTTAVSASGSSSPPSPPVKVEAADSSSSGAEPAEADESLLFSSSDVDAVQRDSSGRVLCPYLDTIERRVLDFDFEKLCSVSLSPLHVYGCLVCGRFFQGRGRRSHAFFHSVDASHHVFINLHTERFYCLPDGYEVHDPSLHDIQFNLRPHYSREEVAALSRFRTGRGLDGSEFIVGLMGLNNINRNDWLNVVVQALMTVTPLRDYCLLATRLASDSLPAASATASTLSLSTSVQSSSAPSLLTPYLAELVCKLSNPLSFKGHVSPHELIQAVTAASKGEFKLGVHADPLRFLSFFLNRLHAELGGGKGGKRGRESIISRCFQGEVKVVTTERKRRQQSQGRQREGEGEQAEDEEKADFQPDDVRRDPAAFTTSSSLTPFLYLSLRLPPTPLFKGSQQQTIIPQIPLYSLLSKFDSQTAEHVPASPACPRPQLRRFCITRLPAFLIVHYQRFSDNLWFREKNPTLVTFPLRGLDMSACLQQQQQGGADALYDLVCNIVHEGEATGGVYRVHVLHRPNNVWYELEDLRVSSSETMQQMVGLSEAYIQVYERRREA